MLLLFLILLTLFFITNSKRETLPPRIDSKEQAFAIKLESEFKKNKNMNFLQYTQFLVNNNNIYTGLTSKLTYSIIRADPSINNILNYTHNK